MSTERKLVRPVNPANLPPELVADLKAFITPDKYTMQDLVLAFLAKHGEATLDDLMIYIYEVRNRVTTRGYMYQMMHRLRRAGYLEPAEKSAPAGTIYHLTGKGAEDALAYIDPKTGELE